MNFAALITLAAALAGAIAAVAGFGIGSILTPLLALQTGTKTAVAAVAIPHLAGTLLRFWRLRRHVDRKVFLSFGATSAAGGLAGAWLHTRATSSALTVVFGCLLCLAGILGLTRILSRMRFGRTAAYVAGALSGGLGGLVGNQGGIRSAAMLGFQVPKESFVATATAIALVVDAARIPIYFATEGRAIAALWLIVTIAALGVLVGTLAGERLLRRIPEPVFRRLVSLAILALGIFMLGAASR